MQNEIREEKLTNQAEFNKNRELETSFMLCSIKMYEQKKNLLKMVDNALYNMNRKRKKER